MKKRFTILMAAITLLAFLALPMGMMGQTRESYSQSYDVSALENMFEDGSSYGSANGYWKVPAEANNIAMISVPITQQPTSDITVTFRLATFGSGTNPSASNTTITAVGTESGSNWSGTGVSSYPSTSTYVNGVMTITMPQNPTTLGGLEITMGVNTGVKIFRLQSLSIEYTYGGSTPQPTTYTVTYDCNGGTSDCPENVTGIEPNTTIILAEAPSKTDYEFDGWSDGEEIYDAGDTYTVNSNVTFTAQWTAVVSSDEHWVLTDLADLTANDVFVIVGNNGSNYAMSNDKGTSNPPTAVAVTVTGNEITSAVAANIKWNISGDATNGYSFYPNGSTSTWLYCTTSNNGVRVGGTNNNKTFVVDGGYLKNSATSRYVGIYNSQDWRCYTSSGGNIANQTFAFYKKVTGEVLPPSITANNVNIAYNATSGEIEYVLNNPVTNGNLSVSEDVDWISNAVLSTTENKVTFTTTANEVTTAREGIITLTYTFNRETITKDVTVTQAAAPVIYTTIPALFAAATGTETSVLVTFNNWVVSGVSTNGRNIFVTDNNGNGFVIYYTTDMSSAFAAGDILSGTAVSCTLKKYNGFAELLNVAVTDLTITSGGTVTIVNIALADLVGVNTGAVVSYENMTCSLENNKYYLSDGTTSLQVYNALYAFNELENGKIYNITGVYQQYNNTKEILPRSTADIEEVEVEHQEYTLTISDLVNVNTYLFAGDESEMLFEGEGSASIYDGTEVMISVDVESGYILESLMVDGTEHVADIDGGMYIFTMPAHNVTVTATAVEISGDQYELYTGTLVEGDYLICYHNSTWTAAMKNTVSSDRLTYNEVIPSDDVIYNDDASIVWHIAQSGDYWTIYSADAEAYAASTGVKNKAQMLDDGTSDMALWTVSGTEAYDFVNKALVDNNIANAYLRNNATYGFACYGTNTGGALSLYKKVEDTPVTETYSLGITGYTHFSNPAGGFYLIASPVQVNPADVDGMTNGTFDLYYYDQNETNEWQNYNDNDETGHFDLVPGKGYLYAHDNDITLEFTGEPYDGDGTFTLDYVSGADMPGWNLIGNPFGEKATIGGRAFYVMNTEGTDVIISENDTIQPMQGIFVLATQQNETVTFQKEVTTNTKGGKIVLDIVQNRSQVVDRAIINLGLNDMLPKFMLNPNNTKLYIPKNGKDYALVRGLKSGTFPVNFEPANNGTYCINVNTEGLNVTYLHLIDKFTGEDFDLLKNPCYRFEARTDDKPNRFELVYKTSVKPIVPVAHLDLFKTRDFGYSSNGSWIINNEGEGILQVIDMNGHILSSEEINGCCSKQIKVAPGIYMLRLINGENVKTQKIVVK